jgi:hypothetical protein
MTTRQLCLIAALVLVPAIAHGQEAKPDAKLLTPFGLSLTVGAGVSGFTDQDMQDVTDPGASWEARVAAGTREFVGLEAAYIGSVQGVSALGLDSDAVLLGSGLEATARINLVKGAFQPYFLAGAGWMHYQLENYDTNQSSVNEDDDVLEVPLGLGFGYRYRQVILDARGMFRPAAYSDLIRPQGDETISLHSWSALLRGGFEF